MIFFCKYVRYHIKTLIMLALFFIIFVVTFLLYHLPIGAVIYPSMLCFIIALVIFTFGFSRAKAKHNCLTEIKQLTAAMIAEMPNIKTVDDEDYQEIIEILKREILETDSTASKNYNDMIDYYTMWVHQIKTPIASMHLTLQNEDTEMSRKLSSDLFRIEQYVEMVLAFLRLDSDFSDYVFKKHSLDKLIKQSVKRFSSEFIGKKIRLEYEPINEAVITDDKWFMFVIEQILSNSLKYTREGSIKIYFTGQKNLCIKDSGIGIAPEDLPRIFDKGYTGCNGRYDKKASGIGLYLCKRVCHNLGIEISAESELDKGTVIRLNLEQYKI